MITITPQYLAEQGFSSTIATRFWAKVNKDGPSPPHFPELGPCWIWTATIDCHGRGRIAMGLKRAGNVGASRVSWIIHFGPIPERLFVLHHCDNPACVRPDHLWLGTQAENISDCSQKGRMHPGELCWNARLNPHKVREIRRLYSGPQRRGRRTGPTIKELAWTFGVSKGAVDGVLRNYNWEWVKALKSRRE